MDITETRQGAVTVLRPEGPLVQGDADEFRDRAVDARTRSLGRFVIDAGSMTYVDSRGLEALLEVSNQMADAGQTLRVCSVNETVREVLELVGLAERFEFCLDVNTAVRSFL
ncbi:MAG: STAS domain-containing protein [Phycisphaeraceae bacterium]|nr:STAS domain-containing protein [Phycisphaerae bacterium]MBX3391478.1 STAS domain-containing protein [Phycisphaeraceae bacterium]